MAPIARSVLTVRQLAVAVGILLAAISPATSNFFAAVRRAQVDCKGGKNGVTCFNDIFEAAVHGLVAVTVTAGAAVLAFGFIPRDIQSLEEYHHSLVSVNGTTHERFDVIDRSWMRANLLEGERTHILANYTHRENAGQFMTEAWLDKGKIRLTQYTYRGDGDRLDKRSEEAYVHYSEGHSDIEEDYTIGATYEEYWNSAGVIFDYFSDHNIRGACVGYAFQPSGHPYTSASLGVQGSYEKTNDAPSCGLPTPGGSYKQIGDLKINDFAILGTSFPLG